MKKLLYTILLSLGTFLFTACTDYINVDKYFYDQVSLDSAFSKRVYVEGWKEITVPTISLVMIIEITHACGNIMRESVKRLLL